jgi:hypothetical protein
MEIRDNVPSGKDLFGILSLRENGFRDIREIGILEIGIRDNILSGN